jgi:hypothetical protein
LKNTYMFIPPLQEQQQIVVVWQTWTQR